MKLIHIIFKRNCLRLGLGLGFIAAMCIIVPVSSPSAQAGTLQWSVVDTPSILDNVIVSPSEINDVAIGNDGRTFYAVDIPNSKFYKSLDGGRTWNDLSGHLASGGASLPAWNVVTAPDNPNFVAVVTSEGGLPRNVFISTDGGGSWQNTNSPNTENIGAIAISPNYGGYDIAIGTRTGAGNGNIYTVSNRSGNWASQGLTGDVLSLKFSPAYRADSSLVTVSADTTGTYMHLGIHDSATNSTNWSTWGPAEVTGSGAGTSPKVNQIITADLELPNDFSGQTSSLRRMYVSLDSTSNAGIYRLDDTVCHLLMPSTPPLRISSLAYYGTYSSGKLLAGEVAGSPISAAAMTWLSNDPVNCSGTCWFKAQKAATGGGNSGYANARVFWSTDGSHAYCATASATLNNAADWPNAYLAGSSLDESAFSLSTDNGETWNQLSLIDTEIDFLSDVAVTPASDTIYLASVNNHGGINSFDSIWRARGAPTGKVWERVLCLLSASDDIIMRTSNAGNNPAIYFASLSTSDLRQSLDGGQTWNNTLPGVNVTDFAVTSIDNTPNIYILDNNYVRRGSNNGQTWQWSTQVDTTLGSGYSINATPTGVITVGDSIDGIAAYSLNNGISFTRTIAVTEPGKMQVIADYRFRNAQVLYAATNSAGSEIYYWVVGSSSYWSSMGPPGRSFYGLAQLGTLYGARSSAGGTAVDRTLEPEKLAPPLIEWDTLTAGLPPGVVFTREPSSLKVSAGINLWAIDNRPYSDTTGRLWNFYDCLSPTPIYQPPPLPSHDVLFQAPVPISPTTDEVIPIYLDTGEIGNVVFQWRHRTAAVEYELWLAKDEAFSQIVLKQVIEPESQLPAWTLPKTVLLEKGKQYFWKVRVINAETGETDEGTWSKTMSFSTASAPPQETSGTQATPVTPPNDATKETKTLPWVATIPPFIWIIFALLVVILLVSVFFVSRAKR